MYFYIVIYLEDIYIKDLKYNNTTTSTYLLNFILLGILKSKLGVNVSL